VPVPPEPSPQSDEPQFHPPRSAADLELAPLGLSEEIIFRCVSVGNDARQQVDSTYFPRNYPGITMWAHTIACLRRELVKLQAGWRIGQSGNYETVYSEERRLAIAVVAGDANTGIKGETDPKLKRRRGPKTTQRVSLNKLFEQMALDVDFRLPTDDLPADEACRTWFLLLHPTAEEIQVELSLAADIGEDGLVSHWIRRILIEPIAISGAVAPVQPDEDEDDGESMVSRPA